MVVVQRKVNETLENTLQELEDLFQELKSRTSELRKEGKDTGIAEILMLDFYPNVKMAKATYKDEDVGKIKKLLSDIKDELDEAENGTDFNHTLELIKDAYEYLRTGKLKEASLAYSAITKEYKKLPEEFKRLTYYACTDIKKKIEKNRKK